MNKKIISLAASPIPEIHYDPEISEWIQENCIYNVFENGTLEFMGEDALEEEIRDRQGEAFATSKEALILSKESVPEINVVEPKAEKNVGGKHGISEAPRRRLRMRF
jgi:hypothetical protein